MKKPEDIGQIPVILDLRGLKCPLPVLKTRAALRKLPAGAELIVRTTDPMSVIDVPHLLSQTGDRLVSQMAEGAGTVFRIEKGDGV